MKILLEFSSEDELNAYIQIKAKDFIEQNREQIIVNEDPNEGELTKVSEPKTTIEDHTRRRYWTDLELQFLKDHYITKNVRWIAKALRRRTIDVQQKLYQMYKKGLPRKHSRNGAVVED